MGKKAKQQQTIVRLQSLLYAKELTIHQLTEKIVSLEKQQVPERLFKVLQHKNGMLVELQLINILAEDGYIVIRVAE